VPSFPAAIISGTPTCSGCDDDDANRELPADARASEVALDNDVPDSFSNTNKIRSNGDPLVDRLTSLQRSDPLVEPRMLTSLQRSWVATGLRMDDERLNNTFDIHRCDVSELTADQRTAILTIELIHRDGGYRRNGRMLDRILLEQPTLRVCIACQSEGPCTQYLGFALSDCSVHSY